MTTTIVIGVFSLFHPQSVTVKALKDPLGITGVKSATLASGQRIAINGIATIAGPGGGPAEMLLSIPGKIERRFYGVTQTRIEGGELRILVKMDMETAVMAAVAGEIDRQAPPEFRKAQAVASRSRYLAFLKRHGSFDACDTTHCQYLREPADIALASGLILEHLGKPVPALYSAACGGRTKTSGEVGYGTKAYPFYSVDCEWCQRNSKPWQAKLTHADGERFAGKPHFDFLRIEIGRRLGWAALPSNNYNIEKTGDGYILRGTGRGHGVGLCQEGGLGMARGGADFRAILDHYFPNARLGAVD